MSAIATLKAVSRICPPPLPPDPVDPNVACGGFSNRISDDNGDGDYEATDNSDNEESVSDDDNDDDVGSNGATDNSDTEKNVSGDDNGDDTNHNRIKKKVTGKRAIEISTNTKNKKKRTEIRAPYQFIFDDEDDGDDVVDDEDGDDNVLEAALSSMLLRDKRKMFSVTGQMRKIATIMKIVRPSYVCL